MEPLTCDRTVVQQIFFETTKHQERLGRLCLLSTTDKKYIINQLLIIN